MEAAIAAFQKPDAASEITNYIESTWRTHISYIEVLNREQREKMTQDLLAFCMKMANTVTDDNVYSLIVACGITFRSFLLDLSQIFPIFDKLFVATREADMIASAKLIIHVSAQTDELNPIFAKRYIKKSLSLLNSKKTLDIKYGLIILHEFMLQLSSIVFLHFPNITDQLWLTIQITNIEIRRLSISVIQVYVQELSKTATTFRKNSFLSLYQKSTQLLLSNQSKLYHSAILIIAALISLSGNLFEDETPNIFRNLTQFLSSSNQLLRVSAISTLIHIAKINAKIFQEQVFVPIFQSLMNMIIDKNTIILTIETLTVMVESIPSFIYVKIPSIIKMIAEIPQEQKLNTIPKILELFLKIIELDPKLIDLPNDIIWKIVECNTISKEWVMFFKKMTTFYPNFEFDHKEKLHNLILSVLSSYSNPCQDALDLISMMHIDLDFAIKLLPLLKSAFFSRSKEHRLSAPRALMHTLETCPKVLLNDAIEIFQLGIRDFSSKVKCAVIDCFDNTNRSGYLISTSLGKSITMLAEDKNPMVRIAYYKLLQRNVSFSPIQTYTTLRRCILKFISTIKTTSTTSESVNYAKSLPTLIIAAKDILDMYADFILNAIVQKMAVSIENDRVMIELETELSIYLVKSLISFTQLRGDSVFSYIEKIRPVLINYIKGKNRELKEAVIDLLTAMWEASGSLNKVYSHLAPLIPPIVDAVGSSTSQAFRVKALKFVGACGAISPSRVGLANNNQSKDEAIGFDLHKMKKNELWMAHFGEVIFDKLLSMMEDKDYIESQQMIFHTAICVVGVMTTIPNKSLEKLIAHILNSIKNCVLSQKSDAISQLENLILITKQRVCPFVPEIMRVIDASWSPLYLIASLRVIIALVIEVHTDFTDYVAPLFPRILESLSASTTGHPDVAKACLPLLAFLGPSYANSVALIFPQICHVIALDTTPRDVLIVALTSMRYLVQNGDPTFHATIIFSSAADYMGQDIDDEIRTIAIDVVFSLMVRIGESVDIYAHRILDVLSWDQNLVEQFEEIHRDVISYPMITIDKYPFISRDPPIFMSANIPNVRQFKEESFFKTFNVGNLESTKQWNTWFNNAQLKWVRNSPCPSVSLLYDIAASVPDLLDFLAFPSFFSCWDLIGQRQRQTVSEKLVNIMNNPSIPDEVILRLLKLAEMLDRVEQPLAVSPTALRNLCVKVKYYSYAIYIDTNEFYKHNIDASAHSAAKLYILTDHAVESEAIMQKFPIENGPDIQFQLGHWDEALNMFENQFKLNQSDSEAFTGIIASANKMKKYSIVLEMEKYLTNFNKKITRQNAIAFARAYFVEKDYKKMYQFASQGDPEILDTHLMTAISSVLIENYSAAEKSIEAGFNIIAQQFGGLYSQNYNATYHNLVSCQLLWETYEILKTKGKPNTEIWKERITNTKLSTESWTPLILLRLSFMPLENQTFLQYLNIALQDHKLSSFTWLFGMLQNKNLIPFQHVYLKYLWASGRREEALKGIDQMIQDKRSNVSIILSYIDWTIASKHDEDTLVLLAERLKRTVSQDSSNYGLTQRWASINFHLFQLHPDNLSFAVEAIRGFVPAIKNSPNVHFSDVLQLLWIFFSTASDEETFKLTGPLFASIHPTKFVDVIPQLVGLLDHSNVIAANDARNIILELARNTSKQKVIFPLLCVAQSLNQGIRDKAQVVLQSVALAYPTEVTQCMNLSTVLISAAITIFDCWIRCEGEKSTYLLDRAHNPKCPLDRLFGRLLGPFISDLDAAIINGTDQSSILNKIAIECERRFSEFDRLRLVDVTNERDIKLDTIEMPGAPGVFISSILPEIDILNTKQHPRRVKMMGADGIIRPFLLKSNEDLALDQRIMQYMKLVNIFVNRDSELSNNNATLREYEIVPLSPQVGLIQWVEGSDTIHRLIEEFRKIHSIDPFVEKHSMELLTISDVDSLRPIQRLETLQIVAQVTSDADLRTILWIRSPSSQDWLARHIHLQRSAAVNSIVGYTIGLGDRHASNIMIDRLTGDMIHIDFGDCFEVNFERILYSERIPFRLSRMLVAAFGLAGVDGEFRKTAEKVMRLIRDNANSFASVLELFLLESDTTGVDKKMIKRTWDKMSGDDFEGFKNLTPETQVDLLIQQATDQYNLAYLYTGWSPLW